MSGRPTILVVDDEPQIQLFVRHSLEASGYSVRQAGTAHAALRAMEAEMPDLVILDLGLPDLDGKAVIGQIRQTSEVPIIVLSAHDQEDEKIAALDLGANDFVAKPFAIGELLARIRASLRARKQGSEMADRIAFADLTIDVPAHNVSLKGKAVRLTPKEFDLLVLLARHPGRVLTHRQILAKVWGPAHVEDLPYLRVFVGQLRQKIETNPAEPQLILTEPGVGYRFSPAIPGG
jgi:two-component system, OmpR family, KDP operon response regulator KdpE